MTASTPVLLPALLAAAQAVKAAAGKIVSYEIFNPGAAVAYVQLIDKASPTVGTDAPKLSIGIKAGDRASGQLDASFLNAISAAATTTATGSTAPATALVANFTIR
jgi:hypothetical protein